MMNTNEYFNRRKSARDFNREYKQEGFKLEYIGYTMHCCENVRTWVLTYNPGIMPNDKVTEWVYSIAGAYETAEQLKGIFN